MNGCIAAGKRSEEKKRPPKIHIGSITRFIRPLTVSVVWARAGDQEPDPREGQSPDDLDQEDQPEAPHDRHPEDEDPHPQQDPDIRDEERQPRHEDREQEVAAGHRGRGEPLEQLADPEIDDQEPDPPEPPAHRVLADQAGDEEVDVAAPWLGLAVVDGATGSLRPGGSG